MGHNILIDIIGWIGAVVLLLAYSMVSTRKMEGGSVVFQLLNLVGSAFLVVNSFFYGAYPSSGTNTVWMGIAFYALLRRKGFGHTV
jgi:hypothetical protein